MDCKKIGAFIAEQRKLNNMTQKDLADRLYVTDKAVSKWERGLCFPDISSIIPLSEIFNISTSELLNGEVKKETSDFDFAENALTESIELFENVQKKKSFRIHMKYMRMLMLLILFIIFFYYGYSIYSQGIKMSSSLYDVSYDLFEEKYVDILSDFGTQITYRDYLYLIISSASVSSALRHMEFNDPTMRENYPEVDKISSDYEQTLYRLYYALLEDVEYIDAPADTVVFDTEAVPVLKKYIRESLQFYRELLTTMEIREEQLEADLFGRMYGKVRKLFNLYPL